MMPINLKFLNYFTTYIRRCLFNLFKIGANAQWFGQHFSIEFKLDYFTNIFSFFRQYEGFWTIKIEEFDDDKGQKQISGI